MTTKINLMIDASEHKAAVDKYIHDYLAAGKRFHTTVEEARRSKMAEFAVYKYLKDLGHSPTLPDLSIHDALHDDDIRFYDSDGLLWMVSHKNFSLSHDKGYSGKSRFRIGYMFGRTDPAFTKHAKHNENWLYIFTNYHDDNHIEIAYGGHLPELLEEDLFGECEWEPKRRTCVVVYAEDLDKVAA